MKTDAERMALIRQRTAQLQRQARTADAADRCRLYGGLSGAGGLPGPCHARLGRHIGRAACFPHRHRRDAGERGADGYILVGVLSFLLGSCVTILLYRLRRRSEKKHTRDDDEL